MYIINKLKALGDFYSPTVSIIKIIIVIIISGIVIKIGSKIIRKVFEKQKSFKHGMDSKKIDTISTLMVSVFRYIVYALVIVAIFTEITIYFNLKSLLAAAGIGGLIIGFGAQSLIKDILSGIFVIMEAQFVVGDLITIDSMTGTVEEMEIRITKIRNVNGDLYIIPNGEIKRVTNHTRGSKAVIVDIPVAYSSNIGKVFEISDRVCKIVAREFEAITEAPEVLGITDLGKDNMNIRIMAKAFPNEHWEIERRIRRLIKEEFTREGIEFNDRNKIIIEDRSGGKVENGG